MSATNTDLFDRALTLHRQGEIDAALISAGTLISATAARVDAGDPEALAQAGVAKLTATRAAINAVSEAVALIGNPGLTRRHPLERHLRDILCSRVHTPQDDSTLTATGRAALATVTDAL